MNANSERDVALTALAADIVAAYVSGNSLPMSEISALIHSVRRAVVGLAPDGGSNAEGQDLQVDIPSAVQIRKSVQQDGIISFLDGKTYKTLKRHLTAKGLSPQSYRERYGLPADYPMVAPSYAERRSALAKSFGLGQPGIMAGRGRKAREAARSGRSIGR